MIGHRLLPAASLAGLMACGGGSPADDGRQAAGAEGNATVPAVAATDERPAAQDPVPAAANGSIPAAFQGSWAESRALCQDTAHHSRLTIGPESLLFHERRVAVASVALPGSREIVITGDAPGEGTMRPAEYHFSLDPSGDTLTDEAGGGTVRKRCA